jgi:hypothetical protein
MLFLCGLGTRFDQMTLETAHHLKTCSRILCANLDAETAAKVRVAFGRAEELRFDRDDQKLEAALLAAAAADQHVAVLMPGHPLLYGPGAAVASLCRRSAVPYRILAAPSSVDSVLAAAEAALEGDETQRLEQGLAIVSAPDLLLVDVPLAAGLTTVVLNLFRLDEQFPDDAGVWGRLARRLGDCYGPDHAILLLEAESDQQAGRWQRRTVAELPLLRGTLTERTTLILPAEALVGTPALP